MLDVHDLPDDQIEFIQQLIEFMRQKHQKPIVQPEDETEFIHLRQLVTGCEGRDFTGGDL